MVRRVATVLVFLSLPAIMTAESYTAPDNVRDPSLREKGRSSDPSLPLIYIEPHDFCYDVAGPLQVTVSAVNRSMGKMTIDWRAVLGSLALEPVGPGRVAPLRDRPAPASVELAAQDLAQATFDLRDRFKIDGAGVYRLSYSRPLEDGRIHLGTSARFVIEDAAAVEKIAAMLDAGPARDTFTALAKANPVFAVGGPSKTYGWDSQQWTGRPQMFHRPWEKALSAAQLTWRQGIDRLTEKGPAAGRARALEALVDRLLLLSGDFRAAPGQDYYFQIDERGENHLGPKQRETLHLKLVRSQAPFVVARSMNRLMSLKSQEGLGELFRIGDGPDRALAEQAIGSLSSYDRDPRIAQYLRRKMTDDDPGLALGAAITSCYSGDGSGGALVVRCLTSDDPALRLRAIAQVMDAGRFRHHRETIVRLLLAEVKTPMSNAHLYRALESLAEYPSETVLLAVTPFLRHTDAQVAERAKATIRAIQRAKGG